MRRIGVYGGMFDPPHLGHFRGAQYALEALGLDRVLLLPDREHPRKPLPEGAPSPQQRLEMVRLGIRAPELAASGLSLERPGPTYAWQTLELLRLQYPTQELYWILGADMLCSLPNWQKAHRILEEATLAVLCRGDRQEARELAEGKARVEAMGGRVILLDNPVTDISSTRLRRLLRLGCAGEHLDPAVEAYILENRLYGVGADLRGLPEPELERQVVSLLKPQRVAHVLGCRDTAVALALQYGADPADAARAALLHDITKALEPGEQLTLCRSYGTILDDFSRNNPKTLHALTGSLVARSLFGENEQVVSAICCHTTGKADMNLLEKIIYVADYMEPNRDFPGVERLRQLAYTDITAALRLGLEMTLELLTQQGREISPGSREALEYLQTQGQ